MTRPKRRVGLAASAYLLLFAFPLSAQIEGSLGVGATRINYEGFLSTSAVVVSPSLGYDASRLSLAAQGSWTRFETGRGVLQGAVSGAWLAGASSRWRVELAGSAGASAYANFQATGHLLGGARFHLLTSNTGGWLGLNSGISSGGPGGVPVEISAAGWTVKDRVTLVGTVTTTWEGPSRSLDMVAGVRWAGAKVELEAHAGARPWARGSDQETGAYGEATAILPVSRRLAFWLGGGKYPSDPVRHTIGATYVSAGLRLNATGKSPSSAPISAAGILRGRTAPAEDGGPPLEIAGVEEVRTLRVRATDAESVEVMADFTDWIPVALVRVARGVWEGQVTIPAGVHRVNIRVNGGPWMAPRGARQERTEFGGSVGIVVVGERDR